MKLFNNYLSRYCASGFDYRGEFYSIIQIKDLKISGDLGRFLADATNNNVEPMKLNRTNRVKIFYERK